MATKTRLTEIETAVLVRLLRLVAEDYRDEKTVLEHIDAQGMPEAVTDLQVTLLTDWLEVEASGYGTTIEDRRVYLEHHQRIMGVTNGRLLSDLRVWLREAAP